MIKHFINKAKDYISRFSNEWFVNYLKNSGIMIGGGDEISAISHRD